MLETIDKAHACVQCFYLGDVTPMSGEIELPEDFNHEAGYDFVNIAAMNRGVGYPLIDRLPFCYDCGVAFREAIEAGYYRRDFESVFAEPEVV